MFTVTILINGRTIISRSAVNKGHVSVLVGEEYASLGCRYVLDDGSEVYHVPEDGPVVLAKKLLDTIEEERR